MGSWCHANAGFLLREKGSRAVEHPIAANQCFVKTWSFESLTEDASTHMLEKLRVFTPGLVFVTSGGHETRVKISGDSKTVLDAFVVSALGSSGIDIAHNQRLDKHFVLIEVVTAVAHTLQHVECRGPSQMIVEDNVLFHPNLKLPSSGDIFVVSADEMRTDGLTIAATGAGHAHILARKLTIHGRLRVRTNRVGHVDVISEKMTAANINLQASGLTGAAGIDVVVQDTHVTKDVQVQLDGSGTCSILGENWKAHSLRVSAKGLGNCWIAARSLLQVKNLQVNASSGGEICLASFEGNCSSAHLKSSGTGALDVREVRVDKAVVDQSGSGDVLLQVHQRLDVSSTNSGDVIVVGSRPQAVRGSITVQPTGPSRVPSLLEKAPAAPLLPTREAAFAHSVQSRDTSVGLWAKLQRYLHRSRRQGYVDYTHVASTNE